MTERFVTALNSSLHALFDADDRVYMLGEDIVDPYGGAFKVTAGLSSRFPSRVLSTPISEGAIMGLAGGMALRGLRPIVEIMFGDFLTLTTDQIVNHLTKYRAMYAGAVSVPVVIRAPSGGGRGYGPTHSQSLEKLFLGVPHLKVVVPSLFHDPGQVFRSAAAEDAPVLFIEHKLLYSLELQHSNAADIHVEELVGGRYPTVGVRNYDDGQPDIVIFGYGGVSRQIKTLLRHLAEEEIRTLVVLPSLINELDMPLLAELASSAAAGCIFWEEGTQGFDWGAEVMAGVLQMSRMKAANMRRLAAMPTIIPAARRLEEEILPSVDRLEQAALELVEAALNC